MTERFDEFPNVAARDAAWEKRAVKWSAFIMVRGQRFREDCESFHKAAVVAKQYEDICKKEGEPNKRALVYAITAEGHATMVQRDKWLIEAEKEDTDNAK